jgi:hypothetical protein
MALIGVLRLIRWVAELTIFVRRRVRFMFPC